MMVLVICMVNENDEAFFLNDCPCAYYVHCFAHRLQLALVTTSKEVVYVH